MQNMEGPPAAIRIEDTPAKVLIGDYKYLKVTVKDDAIFATAELNVTDGALECSGKIDYNEKTQKTIRLPLKCSDGRTGNVVITFSRSTWRADQSAVGIGSLVDNTKLKLILGNMSGTLSW